MSFSPIIEVAIGMIFIFSLLSILVTQINTFIINVLNLRPKQLKEGLMNLVNDQELQARILAHPLIRLVDDTVNPKARLSWQSVKNILAGSPTKVGYIAPSTFVEAMLSLLTAEADSAMFKPLEDGINALPNSDQKVRLREMLRDLRSFADTDTREIRQVILELPNETHKQLLSYALEEVENALGRVPIKSGQLIPLLEGIRKIENPAFQEAINTVLATARNLEEARSKLQDWFNDGMDRISDLYKQRIQYISLIVGFFLSIIMNADTLQLASAFWENPEMRQAISTTAQQNLNRLERQINITPTAPAGIQSIQPTPLPPIDDGSIPPQPETLPEFAQTSQENKDAINSSAQIAVQQSAGEVSDTVQQLIDLQLPIGWEYTPITQEMITTSQAAGLPDPSQNARNLWNLLPSNNPNWFANLLRKLVGIVITMVAIAQGAPFWFDLLRRLSGANTPPASAPSPSVNVNINRDTTGGGYG